ncbi:hypothetical protein AAZX31_10G182100 [Glycine max]|uniref:Uncharacterized protein n=2 Tax=Glycine subgen. Soja TaxID=1462606 RepID=K7LKC1_SOYBN|nr:uncharacterized protein LOC102659661 isoform X2 [Glycine max]XP_028183948.1 uncharacterized protein LOC114370749 isoform X2 [Glycine soja]KAG4983793.1 hypothetical protein JHK87_028542 [Glycine soja]KAG5004612.1 hypothetical protein JHK86_028751 [Glycine max]KAG5127794.1 hypothetical protein JHK82_028629 [Glycine max]KAG5152408.1 hypothetical protein JHK84_028880 [Glycine max]KAH1139035.1 hypothetical protein GYH30_028476 [Glycine max]|eukprot:XP_006589329.1 uncharacterized protein LOC102659661 isoform X2 [Glycine max]
MNSKNQTPIRVFGQRTIASTFRNLPPRNPPSEGNERNQASRKSETAHHSLSHFLTLKPQKSPQTVPGKSTPFLSPLGLKGEEGGAVKEVEKEKNGGSDDKVIFKSFKHTEEDKRDFVDQIEVGELENSVAEDIQESNKRKTPFEGANESQTARNNVVVLGGASKLKPKKGQIGNDTSNKRPRPHYNHYANGRGWWDYDMEGVDNEELGFSDEVWEGVGSTTLGGIVDWH